MFTVGSKSSRMHAIYACSQTIGIIIFCHKTLFYEEKKTTKYKSTSAKNFTPLFEEDKQEYMEKDWLEKALQLEQEDRQT